MLTACPSEPSPAAPPVEPVDAPPPQSPALKPPFPDLPWERPPRLPKRMRIRDWEKVEQAWRTATTAYARRDATGAADHFLELTTVILDPKLPKSPKGRIRRTTRCLAYDNAGAALAAIDEAARARQLLEMAREQDPGCRASLSLRLEKLGPSVTASTTATASTARR